MAQEESGALRLTLSPPVIGLVTEPDKPVKFDVRVQNGGSKSEMLRLGLLKFFAEGEGGKPKLLEREAGDDYFDWVTFSPSVFDVAPNEWKTVTVTISPPSAAAFGYYYAITFSRSEPGGTNAQNTVIGAPAALALLEVRVPNAKRLIAIERFAPSKKVYDFLPATFAVTLENKGNVHAAPRGNIFLQRGDDDVGFIEVNPEKGNILPASKRRFLAVWEDGFPRYRIKKENGKTVLDANNAPVTELEWDVTHVPKLRMGKYTARLFLVYDDGQRDVPLEAETSFWVIPWKILVALSVVAALIGTGLWVTLRGLWRRLRQKGQR